MLAEIDLVTVGIMVVVLFILRVLFARLKPKLRNALQAKFNWSAPIVIRHDAMNRALELRQSRMTVAITDRHLAEIIAAYVLAVDRLGLTPEEKFEYVEWLTEMWHAVLSGKYESRFDPVVDKFVKTGSTRD